MRRAQVLVAVVLLLLGASGCELFGFGHNSLGSIGDGTTTDRTAPTASARPVAWSQVSAATYHSCGTTPAGQLYCWGRNAKGELGLGTTSVRETVPMRVGTATDWSAVSAGGASASQGFTCGIRDGGLYCWGHNGDGQLGDGTATWDIVHTTPNRVGTASDWTAVSAGGFQTCGLRGAGALYCWGPLADGSTATVPTRIGGADDWRQVSVGFGAACGVRHGGSLWCWGVNWEGSLGFDEGTSVVLQPTALDVGGPVAQVTRGSGHTCARRTDGSLWCWGSNTVGELGLGFVSDVDTDPVVGEPSRVGTATDWSDVSAADSRTCGIRSGLLHCWGNGYAGDGSTALSHSVPTRAAGEGWLQVDAGMLHVVAIRGPEG